MFQSTGLFRDVSCPYFLYGLCERPFCHFKHSRQEEAKARKEAEKAAAKESESEEAYIAPTSGLQKQLQAIEENIISEKRKLDPVNGSTASRPITNIVKNKPTGTPEYNPTPLKQLKKQRIHGKLGRSKYELALLDTPSSAGEYDPASNYSTSGGKLSDQSSDSSIVPEYAKELDGNHGLKRSADDTEELGDPLAKIPRFVSMEYTPTVTELEVSDEEPLGEQQDWFSDSASEKSSDTSISETPPCTTNNTTTDVTESSVSNEVSTNAILPIEFTADGCVKNVWENVSKLDVEIKKETKKELNQQGKNGSNQQEKKGKNHKAEKDDNIFSLFKEEFDKAFESCSNAEESNFVTKEKSENSSGTTKVKEKKSNSSLHSQSVKDSCSVPSVKEKGVHKTLERKSSFDTQTVSSSSHRHSSSHSDKSSKTNHKVAHHQHHDEKHKQKENHRKHSHDSVDKPSTSSNSSDKHKTDGSKRHSSSKHSHSSSSHSSSKSSDHKDKDKNHHHKEGKHKDKSSHCECKNNKDKSRDSRRCDCKNDKDKSRDSRRCDCKNDKDKSRDSRRSDKGKGDKHSHKSQKKKIVDLNVDLFGVEDKVYLERKRNAEMNNLPDDFFDDDDPFDECLKIFNEGSSKPSTSSPDKKKMKKSDKAPETVTGKKRVALKQADPSEKKSSVVEKPKPKPKPSPAQVMMDRYKQMQEKVLQAEEYKKEKQKAKVKQISQRNQAKSETQTSSKNISGAGAMFNAYLANKNKKTSAITVAKGSKRKAHTPTVPIEKLKRPTVEVSTSSKVSTVVRQRYLNLFIDECLKLCTAEKEAFDRGKEEEEAVYKRCSNKQIYLNIAVNTIKRLRVEVAEKSKKSSTKTKASPVKLSHQSLLDGALASKTTYTINRSGGAVKLREEDFTGADLYKRLQQYLLTDEQLVQNNFPRAHPEKGGMAVFHVEEATSKKGSTKGYEKLCVRCGKVFEVYPNGKYPVTEECVYHWGKAWKKKIAGSIETRYTCCSGDLASEGCQVAKAHVHEWNKKESVRSGFMKTIPCSPPIDGDYGVYALDCEMVYTTMGIELARVTVCGSDEEPVYESMVLPDNRVVDFNTRFSGISEEDMEGVETSLRDVQAVLLSLFTDKTILLGHSLESDLTTLKLIHSTVVDTSIVFPHRMGLPYKRALRNLMVDYLKKIIQDDVGGHDSQEDAVACLQLMQYQLKEDARKEARRLAS